MGKITVFSSGDLNSKRVIKALTIREIPFTEVSLLKFPSKRTTVKSVAFGDALPQVFFNTRHVGGVTETLEELQCWDEENKYATPRDAYEARIAQAGDPKHITALLPRADEKPEIEIEESLWRKAPLSIPSVATELFQ